MAAHRLIPQSAALEPPVHGHASRSRNNQNHQQEDPQRPLIEYGGAGKAVEKGTHRLRVDLMENDVDIVPNRSGTGVGALLYVTWQSVILESSSEPSAEASLRSGPQGPNLALQPTRSSRPEKTSHA